MCDCEEAAACVWWVENTMVVQLGELVALGDAKDAPLTDALTGAVIADAVVTATLYDLGDAAVAGETWPLSVPAVSGGVYRGAASAAVAVAEGQAYRLKIVATKSGNTATYWVPVTAARRAS